MFTKTGTFIATAATLGLLMPGIAPAETWERFSAQATARSGNYYQTTGVLDGQTVATAEAGHGDGSSYASVDKNHLLSIVYSSGFSESVFTDTLKVVSDTLPVGTPVTFVFSNWLYMGSEGGGEAESYLQVGTVSSTTSTYPETFQDVPMLTVHTEVGAVLPVTGVVRVRSSGGFALGSAEYHCYSNWPEEAGFKSAGLINYNPYI